MVTELFLLIEYLHGQCYVVFPGSWIEKYVSARSASMYFLFVRYCTHSIGRRDTEEVMCRITYDKSQIQHPRLELSFSHTKYTSLKDIFFVILCSIVQEHSKAPALPDCMESNGEAYSPF